MCLALYLFTNSSLAPSPWNEAEPGVFVQDICERADQNARSWSHEEENIYYIGGYQGCGCGWSPVDEWDDPSDLEAKPRDRMELGRILRSIDLESSWFVICWEGDQGEKMQAVEIVSIEQIENHLFEFAELQQYRIAQ